MASFRKRNSKWEARVRRQGNKAICKTFTNIEDAKRWAREQESKLDKGMFEDLTVASKITLKELLLRYLNEVSINKKGYEVEKYKINKLCRHQVSGLKLIKITPLVLRDLQNELIENYNASTVNKYLTLISISIKFARQILGIYLPTNPCEFIKRLKEPEFIGEIIERDEEKVLLEKAELSKAKWLKLAIILGIDCGIRRGEILKIHRSDIDFNKSTVVLKDTKNGSSRKVGLSKRAIEEIKTLPININGKLINCLRPDTFNFYWQQLKRWTGVRKRFHASRHTFATRASMNGWTITEISAQGGWKDLKVLKRYTHISAEHLAKKIN